MDIGKLKAELVEDPESIGYSGMTDEQAAAALSVADRSYLTPIGSRRLLEWSMKSARLADIEDATTTGPEPIRAIARGAMFLLSRSDTELDPGNATHVAMINGLIAGGVLSDDDKAELIGMGQNQRSRAAEVGLGEVRASDIMKARAM